MNILRCVCFFLVLSCALNASDPSPTPSQTGAIQESLLDQTLNYARGHQEFRELYFKQHEQEFVRLVEEGQSPQTLFIACSDSRLIPDLILNTRPGDLFVIRTAGNFVPTYAANSSDGVSATIQYAVEVLNVRHIIVCGHSHCGAIEGLFKTLDPTTLGILQRWLKFGEQAKKMTLMSTKPSTPKEEVYSIAARISVIYQLEHLLTFPSVKKRVDDGTLELHGWYFTIETGDLSYYNNDLYRFLPLTATLKARIESNKQVIESKK